MSTLNKWEPKWGPADDIDYKSWVDLEKERKAALKPYYSLNRIIIIVFITCWLVFINVFQ